VTVPHIIPDAIHVWTFRLDIADWRDRLRPEWLSADEVAHAGRFAFPALRRRFVVCRTTLRAILGSYLRRRPGELTFAQGPYGKPYLNAARARGRIRSTCLTPTSSRWWRSASNASSAWLARRPVDEIEVSWRSFAPAERLAFRRSAARAATLLYRHWTLRRHASKRVVSESVEISARLITLAGRPCFPTRQVFLVIGAFMQRIPPRVLRALVVEGSGRESTLGGGHRPPPAHLTHHLKSRVTTPHG
jgi:hypothetical protein